MSLEERGKDEELATEASSAELTPPAAEEPAGAADDAAAIEAASEEAEAAESSEAVNGSGAVETAADASAEAQAPAPEESEAAEEPAQPTIDADAAGAQSVAEAPAEEADAASEDHPDEAAAAEEAAAPAESQGATEAEVAEEPAPAKETSRFKRGQVYRGVISATKPTAVTVDLGEGDQGVVPGRELELMTRKLLESLVVGAEIDVYVVNPRNHRGETILSINHALEELDWRNAEDFAKSKAMYDALIGGYNKGGLIVRFGRLRGFVPQSQLAEERARSMSGATPEERYGPMVNQPIGVKVMEVDRHRNRLILSERAASREVRQARKEALIAELKVGDIRSGLVVSLENFGAFVDIGGGEGLVHVSELAWGHVTHPRQAVKVGDEVEVEVISIDPKAKRIGLSRRRVLRDPWDEVATALRRGQLVRGRITKLTKFGAFARLTDYDAIEGLIHISELSGERVTHPREVVNRGDELVLRVVKIDIRDRRLGLSLKSVNSTEYLDLDWEMAIQESVTLQDQAAEDEAPEAQAAAETPDAQAETED
ncbi:MAG: S1 RNA-binding domain-containing protein [Chloroflexota bacterium]|nr:S1 RNA-binding domain-containing protein [Chloroflexota bacterium]MDE2947880.1 S1 RNA-binding domain-containing protein [Chloroflexota bacterium]